MTRGTSVSWAPGCADVNKHAGRALDLTWHLLAHRVWSTAARFSTAPECYAPLLSHRLDDRRAAAEGMKRSVFVKSQAKVESCFLFNGRARPFR